MSRLDKLQQRRIDELFPVRASMKFETFRRLRESESVRYAVGAMQPIDPEYTKNTFAQGDRVKNQLQQRLPVSCEFEYQGSVTTDIHIKARSDIDLLVIHTDWEWLEPPQRAEYPYQGDASEEMRRLRRSAVRVLGEAFPEAGVDADGTRSIKISGGSLTREVDVVPASWYNTNDYVRTGDKTYRGVKVFDYKNGSFSANTPFLHKRRIEEKDAQTNRGLRMAARLMKSLKYDSEDAVAMSSYNIVGIAYNIPASALIVPPHGELAILDACYHYCHSLLGDEPTRFKIRVPDEHRGVFGGDGGAQIEQLRALTRELTQLRDDVLRENVGTIRDLARYRIDDGASVLTLSR